MATSKAEVRTEHAVSYIKQLCRHWAHRFPVEFDDAHGRIELPAAVCLLAASPAALGITLELGEGADQARMEQVVEEHVRRFAFREELNFPWQRG